MIAKRLLAQRLAGLTRRVRPSYRDPDSAHLVVDGRPMVSFASNDYLGLGAEVVPVQGHAGASASRLLGADITRLLAFEAAFATWLGYEAAAMFPSGYQANVGVMSSIVTPQDIVFCDKSIHASLWDGIRLSGATVVRFPHQQLDVLAQRLHQHRHRGELAVVVVESLYSMEGDWTNISKVIELAQLHDCLVVVDEAHSLGIVGPEGRGWVAAGGWQSGVDIWLGAFGKAWGSAGGVVATSREWLEWMTTCNRAMVFSTAPSPILVARNEAILHQMPMMETRRQQLHHLSQLAGGKLGSPIIPIPMPSVNQARFLADSLWQTGMWVPMIQYPTVPKGRPQLRVSLSASHHPHEVLSLMALIQEHHNVV